jgi:hypothetical protein
MESSSKNEKKRSRREKKEKEKVANTPDPGSVTPKGDSVTKSAMLDALNEIDSSSNSKKKETALSPVLEETKKTPEAVKPSREPIYHNTSAAAVLRFTTEGKLDESSIPSGEIVPLYFVSAELQSFFQSHCEALSERGDLKARELATDNLAFASDQTLHDMVCYIKSKIILNKPNPSRLEREAGLSNVFESKAERNAAREDAMEVSDSEDGEPFVDDERPRNPPPSGEVIRHDDRYYLCKSTPAPSFNLPPVTTPFTTPNNVDVTSKISSAAPCYIPLPEGTSTRQEAQEIADFISGRLNNDLNATPSEPAVPATETSAAFFVHGSDSFTGATSSTSDESDYYEWSIPNSLFKHKLKLPRLGKLDDVEAWQSEIDSVLLQITNMLGQLQPKDNPFASFTAEEQRIAMLQILDPHMLLKQYAQKELSTRYFTGYDMRRVSSAEILRTLKRHLELRQKLVSKDSIMRQLRNLRMIVPTFKQACNGETISEAFAQLFLQFTGILENYKSQDFDGTTALSHTLMTLIEPQTLRRYMIKYLYDQIRTGQSVVLYKKGRQLILLTNVWTIEELGLCE